MSRRAVLVDLADAVAAALNAEDFSADFVAAREYVPVKSLQNGDLAGLAVTVVGISVESTNIARGLNAYRLTIDVGIQKETPASDTQRQEIDALMKVAEEMADFLNVEDMTTAAGLATPIDVVNDPACSAPHLAEDGVFTSVITIVYQLNR